MASPTDGPRAGLDAALLHPVRLGPLTAADNLWLAPMAGYTDAAFRAICARHGATLCFTEMVSAEGLAHDSRPTLRLLERRPEETIYGVQIFCSDPVSAAVSARRIGAYQPAILDLNCGCSVPKILKGGCGAALLRDPRRIGAIVRAMRAETGIPVSVKLRLGWDASSLTYLTCAEEAVSAGAVLVALHPRTRSQGFGGKAEWEHIQRLKRASSVPVFGSGDLLSPDACLSMLRDTGCDGILIARGTLGNPFIFEQTRALLTGRPMVLPDARQRLAVAMDHLRMTAGLVGEPKACRDMRKHFVAYTRGMEGGAALRQALVHAVTLAQYEGIVAEYLGDPSPDRPPSPDGRSSPD